ncbi:radical SAM family heme chaperone HemW [Aminipila sp.]|uniref:radical SAM family heme chaperone HemW n=1 Tax=Aminipila sp. TaxID=2060095 RepID=UPI0028A1B494|nr:radical SAM family heme chaperone HemW [Aminipila sp.]
MKKLGVYIHIPFCIKKCLYCDFLSFENSGADLHRRYIDALKRELEYYFVVYGNDFTVDTIFFGGGTPSLIDANLLKEVLILIKDKYKVEKGAEITIECNPKTIDAEKLKIYKEAGINRISIGIQTFNDMALKRLGRVHQSEDAKETYALARQAGFGNINIDLMFAIPEHTKEVWQETLQEAIHLNPEHISFYSLQLEEGTRYFEMFEKGELNMVSDIIDRDMYHGASKFLKESGYNHYEISNCAKPGFECKHNLKYWDMGDYLGIGLGAHSYMNGERFSNTRDLGKYIQQLQPDNLGIGIIDDHLKTERKWVEWQHTNTEHDDMVEFIITGMRRAEGINLTEFENRFGKKLFEAYPDQEKLVKEYVENELMILENDRIRFTIKGVDVSNTVLSEFV